MSGGKIKISVKGLAKYMTAGSAQQRKILKDFKYPNTDQATAMRVYYRAATAGIKEFHRRKNDIDWLENHAALLVQKAEGLSSGSANLSRQNARALRQYGKGFAGRKFDIQSDLQMYLEYFGVRISVKPELVVVEKNRSKIVKLDFSSRTDERAVQIISQCTFEAAKGHLENISGSSILYLRVNNGTETRAAKARSVVQKDIEAACQTIKQLWDQI